MSKKYYWLKIQENFFNDNRIIYLETVENGARYIKLWLKMLLKCLERGNGFLRLTDKIPFDEVLLARILNEDIDTVRVGMKYFQELGMIKILDDKTIYIEEVLKLTGSESESTERVRKHREKINKLEQKKQIKNVTGPLQCNSDVTNCNTDVTEMKQKCNTDIDKDIEKDIDKDIDIELEKEEQCDFGISRDTNIVSGDKNTFALDKSSASCDIKSKTELHNKIKLDFKAGYKALTGEVYYHDGGEAGSIDNIIKRCLDTDNDYNKAYEKFLERAKNLYKNITTDKSDYWQKQAFVPKTLISLWNKLQENKLQVKNKSSPEELMENLDKWDEIFDSLEVNSDNL